MKSPTFRRSSSIYSDSQSQQSDLQIKHLSWNDQIAIKKQKLWEKSKPIPDYLNDEAFIREVQREEQRHESYIFTGKGHT